MNIFKPITFGDGDDEMTSTVMIWEAPSNCGSKYRTLELCGQQ
jgi:hypothetical protein